MERMLLKSCANNLTGPQCASRSSSDWGKKERGGGGKLSSRVRALDLFLFLHLIISADQLQWRMKRKKKKKGKNAAIYPASEISTRRVSLVPLQDKKKKKRRKGGWRSALHFPVHWLDLEYIFAAPGR